MVQIDRLTYGKYRIRDKHKNSTLKNLWALTVPAVVLGKPVLVQK